MACSFKIQPRRGGHFWCGSGDVNIFWKNSNFQKFTMAARFEFPNPPHTRPCRLERVHTPTAHLFRKCSNGAFCTSKQRISPRRNDRVRPHTRGGRPHRSGARPTARPQQQQQHQQPQHQQQTAARQQHHKFARSEHHNLGRSNQPTAAGSRGAPATRRRLSVTRRPFRGLCHATRGYRSAQRQYYEHHNLDV